MRDITLTLSSLHSKIEKLVHLHRKAEEDKEKLRKKNEELLMKIEDQGFVISKLEKKCQALRLAGSLNGTNDQGRAESKKKINELVREIDKCIALLNR